MIFINQKANVSYVECDVVFTEEDILNTDVETVAKKCAWHRFNTIHIPRKLEKEFNEGVRVAIRFATTRGVEEYSEFKTYYKS